MRYTQTLAARQQEGVCWRCHICELSGHCVVEKVAGTYGPFALRYRRVNGAGD